MVYWGIQAPNPSCSSFSSLSLRAKADFSNTLETERVGQREGKRQRVSLTHTHKHIHTETAQGILSQNEYYREGSGSCGEEGTVLKSALEASGGHRK